MLHLNKMADPELSKAFAEHQAKVLEINQKVAITKGQIEGLKLECAKFDLTNKELSVLPPGVRLYESVGRLFILTPFDEVRENIKKKNSENKERMKKFEKNIEFCDDIVKKSEDSVRELVSQKRK